MKIKEFKKIHCVGIGGIGLSGFALLAQNLGAKVTGSELFASSLVDTLASSGIKVVVGEHDAANVPKDATCLVYSSAVPDNNPERDFAFKKKIPQFDYHEALGMLTQDSDTIVVTGTHGKTTTTAMLAMIMANSKLKPSALIGSHVPQLNGNVLIGSSKQYILEGDEYKKGILHLHPSTIVLNNVEWDHPDIYPTEYSYIETFNDFVAKLPRDGLFVYNADDHTTVEHIAKPACNCVSFGLNTTNVDLTAKNIKIAHGRQIFRFVYKGVELKDFNIKIPGRHNIYNALAASLAALEMGIHQDVIKDALSMFPGVWRRFEHIGQLKGAEVISDYAHHPTALKHVISAAKEFYPGKSIVVYFQPHQKARTRSLLKDFSRTLDECGATSIILHEIYDVVGRSDEEKISSKDIIKGMKKKCEYVSDFEEGFKLLSKHANKDSIILVVGAGDIDKEIRGRINAK